MIPNLKLSYYNFHIPYPAKNLYLVYNSLGNSMIQLDWETGLKLAYLNSMEIHHLPIDVIELLKKNRMIVPVDFDEFAEVGKGASLKRTAFDYDETLFILFSPTNMCNMGCPYCYQGDKSAATVDAKYLSRENIDAIKDFYIKRLNNPHATPIKKVHINWFGGEPLLQKKIIEELSSFILKEVDARNLKFYGEMITNGYLLDEKTWDLLDKCRIYHLQVTIDGNEVSHNKVRKLLSGKESYNTILNNLNRMPRDKFDIAIRINGDKEVFDQLPSLFDDFIDRGLWPWRGRQISFHWAPKFFNFLGFNQEKNIYYTSYEYQKSKEDFANLRLKKYNDWAISTNNRTKNLRLEFPTHSEFYCNTVESPNSFSLDSSGYIHKCYNTVNNKARRIMHVSEFEQHDERFHHYKQLNKTQFPECSTCKVLPICNENCNMHMLDKTESKICSPWKYFMTERMITLYDQEFADKEEAENPIETV